jgi:hypothetical protein
MQPPGGNILTGAGGYLQLWNWQSGGSITSPPTPINYRYLDVAFWRLKRDKKPKRLSYSGCFGSTRRRYIINDWAIECRVWWDYLRPPEVQLQDGDTLAIKLVISAESNWQGSAFTRRNGFESVPPDVTNPPTIFANGAGILPAGSTFIPSYCAPQGLLTTQLVSDSSEGNEDGVVFQDVILESDSLLWYVGSTQDASNYGSYVTQLANQRFLAFG